MSEWHIAEDELRAYARGDAAPPWLWSTEAHLASCGACRYRLAATDAVAPLVESTWRRMDTELDAPAPGLIERLLVRSGVREHTARLLAATPVLRLSWLAAIAWTLVLTTVAAYLAQRSATPIAFLAVAPLLPLLGVAVSFGPKVDPSYEIALVAPMHTFRLLLLRCTAVVATTTALSALASLAMPDYGLVVLGWFLPALVLTLTTVALAARLGPIVAAAVTGGAWAALLVATVRLDTGTSPLFTAAGQVALAVAGMAAAAAVHRLRPAFDRRMP